MTEITGYRRDSNGTLELAELRQAAQEALGSHEYEYEYPCELPEGWGLAIYPDGRAMVCSLGTCPEELGGHELASSSREEALAEARQFIRQL